MNKLRSARAEKKLSQRDLAKLTGVSRVSIARYETNKQQPTMEKARRLAAGLGKSVDDLFGADDPSTPTMMPGA